jgi:hypothetical protein
MGRATTTQDFKSVLPSVCTGSISRSDISIQADTCRKEGDGGSHPSNVHDHVYAIGAINYTGDMPVVLTIDGPSLGGFMCPVTVISSEMWKMGSVLTLEALNQLTSAVVSRGTAGMMLWSIQKQSSGITPTEVSQTICTNLGLQECSCPLFCPRS